MTMSPCAWIVPNSACVSSALSSACAAPCKTNAEDSFGAFSDEELATVALLDSSSDHDPSLIDYLRHGGISVVTAAKGRLIRVMSLDRRANRPVDELTVPHWKLAFLAVSPERTCGGIGSAFLQESIIPYVGEHGGDADSGVVDTLIQGVGCPLALGQGCLARRLPRATSTSTSAWL